MPERNEVAPAPAPRMTRVRAWRTPLRSFVGTETGSAVLIPVAAAIALVWINVSTSSYDGVWDTTLSIHVGSHGLSYDLRHWVNSGLMTFFFFVIGLEVRREFDMGELRERRRVTLPLAAGLGGIVAPVAIFLALNAANGTAHGWAITMTTDTAVALGVLALAGPRAPRRLRVFLLTVSVVDDIAALVVIATVYTESVQALALGIAVAIFAVIVLAGRIGIYRGAFYAVAGAATWVALSESGVDPAILGLAMGVLTYAAPARRTDLQRAIAQVRRFREQPTPELARSARIGLRSAISPNERLQLLYHPWVSYFIVPVFVLANAGIVIDATALGHAFTSPVTLGILFAAALGKPLGVTTGMAVVTRLSHGRLRPPVGWAAALAAGAVSGVGFTISLLITSLVFSGVNEADAKVGIMAGAIVASVNTWLILRLASALPSKTRTRALLGQAEPLIDLAVDVDEDRDHVRGPADATVTLVEYGDFECPFCGRAADAVHELLEDFGDVRYVWRHLPLIEVHPHAYVAAEAAEAAGRQGAFWEMHEYLLDHQDELTPEDLLHHAAELGLEVARFEADLEGRRAALRIAEDVESADLSGVSGTPTFFVNGRRVHGAYDVETLAAALRGARLRAEA